MVTRDHSTKFPRPPKRSKKSVEPEPVTAERIERALDGLARIMVDAGAAGRVYLPIYVRLERELAKFRAEDDAMARVRGRLGSEGAR